MRFDNTEFVIQCLETNGFFSFQLDGEDLAAFETLISDDSWTPDFDGRYKSIPSWANRYLVEHDRMPHSFDECSDLNLPTRHAEWGARIFCKYFPSLGEPANDEDFGVALWNGAENTGWHTDNDGSDGEIESYSMILYHTPIPLLEADGGQISFKRMSDSGEGIRLTPSNGMGLLFKIDTNTFLHKAEKLVNYDKDRFCFSVAVGKRNETESAL